MGNSHYIRTVNAAKYGMRQKFGYRLYSHMSNVIAVSGFNYGVNLYGLYQWNIPMRQFKQFAVHLKI